MYVTEPLTASDTTSKTVNVTSIGYFYFDGSVWQKLNAGNAGTNNDWSLLGNTGTNSGINFIGTTDDTDFIVKTKNAERERTYGTITANNTIKKITGGDLILNRLTLGKGKGNEDNTIFGFESLNANTTGTHNIGMGSYALYDNITGQSNVAIGHSSMVKNTEGNSNVAIGQSALTSNMTGNGNVAIGLSALSNPSNTNPNISGSRNVAIGFTCR
ncbi:hypothetical protein [Chryseobacterium indoltheticum]|uniref:hypothetical protein n=1 Tax=Chryseobacterium indoltheticum TaxID=254 RepID=UPI003F499DDC